MYWRQIKEKKLAHYAYLIGDEKSKEAILIDPQRDIDRYINIANKDGIKIVAVTETHIHADYLSGLREFAERGIVKIYASDEGDADWKYEWLINSDYNYQLLRDGDNISVGTLKLKVMHTPGHTPEHLVFLVSDENEKLNSRKGIVSGDFIFVGDVGRPDLLETAAGIENTMESSAESLFDSIQKFKVLPKELYVWPGHGAGSACGKSLGTAPESTVENELKNNSAILAATESDKFVNYILDGQPEPPSYFARMKLENRMGPDILGSLPEPRELSPDEIEDAFKDENVVIIDLRDWESYKESHLPDALFAQSGNEFTNSIGSFVKKEQKIVLVINSDMVKDTVTDLIRIGLDNVAAFVTPETMKDYVGSGGQVSSIDEIDVHDFRGISKNPDVFVLDVRKNSELKEIGFIPGASNIAHTRLLLSDEQLPKDKEIYVYCMGGARGTSSTSYLKSKGYSVTHLKGGFQEWRDLSFEIEEFS